MQLDFKTLAEPNMERGDDKRQLAQMLSAFANSSSSLRKKYDRLAELARHLETMVREQSDFTEDEQFIKIKDQFKTQLLQVISFNLL